MVDGVGRTSRFYQIQPRKRPKRKSLRSSMPIREFCRLWSLSCDANVPDVPTHIRLNYVLKLESSRPNQTTRQPLRTFLRRWESQ
ncbi:hypothetical protein GBAR_LOCUS19872 [Geodia barretti]|uniref:Uncharacterized protein n=1 Tax=Geodia barretti TaxID=519541 RepID=A0AA35SU58_GEOBA|nr:hypothetical protein GBAR_LOCUS19872 [Geodia barretti]